MQDKPSFSERLRAGFNTARCFVFRTSLTNWDVFGMAVMLLAPSGGFWIDMIVFCLWIMWVMLGELVEFWLRGVVLRSAARTVQKELDEAAEKTREALRQASSDSPGGKRPPICQVAPAPNNHTGC